MPNDTVLTADEIAAASRAEEEAKLKAEEEARNLPFHKNPEMQDYINRQVEAKSAEKINDAMAKIIALQGQKPAQAGDESDQMIDEIAAEGNLDENSKKVLKKLMVKVKAVVEKQSAKESKELKEKVENMEITMRMGAVFNAHPDAKELTGKMSEVFSRLTALEKQFALYSPEGGEWLYNKTKSMVSSYIVTPQEKTAGSSLNGKGVSVAAKTGEEGSAIDKAAEALAKGDKNEYHRLIASLSK